MKNYLLLTIVTVCFFTSRAQQSPGSFHLTGTVKGQESGLLYLYYSDKDNKRVKDSANFDNGKFSFKGAISEPTMAYLQLKEEKRSEENATSFFLEPVALSIEITANDLTSAKLVGSKTQDEYGALESKKKKIHERWKIVMDTLTAVNKRSNVAFQELKDWVLLPYEAELHDMDFEFFKQHPQSYVTAFLLRFYTNDLTLDSLGMYYNRLGKKIQQSNNAKEVAKEIAKIKAGSPGSPAAAFATVDIDAKPLSLADFKGKYVLLDFWASWCVPCRKGNPHLKELYAKYHDKGIEFIGVSDDDRDTLAWHKAVQKDELPWRHVLRGLDMDKIMNNQYNEKDISDKFGISSLPTKILIDPQGKIIGRYSEDSEQLDALLKSIFGS